MLPKDGDKSPRSSASTYGLSIASTLCEVKEEIVIEPDIVKTDEITIKSECIEDTQFNDETSDSSSITEAVRISTPVDEVSQCQFVPEIIIKCEPESYEINCSNSSHNGQISDRDIVEQRFKSSTQEEITTLQIARKKYVLPSEEHEETDDSKPKCCPHCSDTFEHAKSLRRHIRVAHSDKFNYAKPPLECPICKKLFAKNSMKVHMAAHSMIKKHYCNICNKSFNYKNNLRNHLWIHADSTDRPFKCEHCSKSFGREADLKSHMITHKQIKPYTCEYCGSQFVHKNSYLRHRSDHEGRRFKCDVCKKTFNRHDSLPEHICIPASERSFPCTICGKNYKTKRYYNKHLRTRHDPFAAET